MTTATAKPCAKLCPFRAPDLKFLTAEVYLCRYGSEVKGESDYRVAPKCMDLNRSKR